jgi:asparagine synthase (glutamine-hydrolysing)
MCGICGAVAVEGTLDPEIHAALPAMTSTLSHRGPDEDGFHQDERAALGHRRLSIIDRAGGQQPLANEDGSVWIVFNGEVYNHQDLRRKLTARGHRFRTHSDTEAIVHAYEEYGESCVEHLEGMFAFAIYDGRRGDLFLARDRLGKKPLFYAALGGAVHFASEIKALRQSPAWDGEIDPAALEMYMPLGYILAPRTIYRHVHKLEPGHTLLLRDGAFRIRRYWDVTEFDTDGRHESAILTDLEESLGQAVAARLESEVPLGAFLSGGIDSGLVVSWMAASLRQSPLTVSVGFEDAEHNELDAAGRVAQRFATRHHAITLEPRLDGILEQIVDAFDEPFADSSAIPTFFVCGAARRHVTVCLSGDGGDETFGGYDFRYVPHALECGVRRFLPGTPGRSLARWLGKHWPRSPRLPRPLRIGTLLENVGRSPEDAYYADLTFLKSHDARLVLGQDPARDPRRGAGYAAVTEPYMSCPSPSPLQRAQYADLKIYLPNDVLVKVDRMSMQHSLEVRCPILERQVVEAAFRVPTERKMPRLRAKHLLHRLAEIRLPPENLGLPKHGFTAPIGRWMVGAFADRYRDEVLGPGARIAGLLDQKVLSRWFEDHRLRRADRSYPLWAAWMIELWARRTASESDVLVVSPQG